MDIIIFGISGDLAEKKLIPSLIKLYQRDALPDDTRLIGFSRKAKSLDHHEDLPFPYTQIVGSYGDSADFLRLKEILRPNKKQLFYLALPPEASWHVLVSLHDAGLGGLILVEKPFGRGYEDVESLIRYINESFDPGQCLKVDHYAGKKELRGINIDASHMSRITSVTFEILETATVEHRGGFYDSAGALRDVGQNHLLLMLAMFFQSHEKESRTREEVFTHITIDPDTSKYHFGFYEGYHTIETFFSIPVRYSKYPDIEITIRSGKGLSKNSSAIRYVLDDGTSHSIILTSGTSAYENILTDAIEGKHDTFLSDKEVLASWKFIEEVEKIKEKAREEDAFITYPVGSDINTLL